MRGGGMCGIGCMLLSTELQLLTLSVTVCMLLIVCMCHACLQANFDDKARSMTVACECDGACLDFT